MKVRNKSESIQALTGIPSFEAGEEREVDEETGSYLLRNPYFEEVKKVKAKNEAKEVIEETK